MSMYLRRAGVLIRNGLHENLLKLTHEINETMRRRNEHAHAQALNEMPITRTMLNNSRVIADLRERGIRTVGDVLAQGEGRFLLMRGCCEDSLQTIWDRCQAIADKHDIKEMSHAG
ncbi:MAG: hypothetical protein QM811_06975 [Pirellulales bacterium]